MAARRSKDQIARDRAAIVEALRRRVRREWDEQVFARGSDAGLFGGAGAVLRRRAYVALAEVVAA